MSFMCTRIISSIIFISIQICFCIDPANLLSRYELSEDLRIFQRYDTLTINKVNMTNYQQKLDQCFDISKIVRCLNSVNDEFRNPLALWTKPSLRKCDHAKDGVQHHHHLKNKQRHEQDPKKHSACRSNASLSNAFSDDRVPDCSYLTRLVEFNDINGSIELILEISAHSCFSQSTLGGFSFETFAMSKTQHVGCSQIGSKSQRTYISCIFDLDLFNHLANENQCVRVTSILSYEHYDGVGEGLFAWSNRVQPISMKILDDVEFCPNISTATMTKMARVTSKHYDLEDFDVDFKWYSGRWVNATALNLQCINASKFFHNSDEILSEYEHHQRMRTTFDLELSQNTRIGPLIATWSKAEPHEYADHFQFQPIIMSRKSGQYDIKTSSCDPDPIYNLEQDTSRKYVLFGSSHIRYLFDSSVLFFMNSSFLVNVSRTHESYEVRDIRYNNTVYVHELIDNLKSRCSEELFPFEDSRNKNTTFVVQTGAWDLSVSSMRRLIHSKRNLNILSDTIRDVVMQKIPCGRMNHIVFMLSMPHPLCITTVQGNCNKHRSHRTTTAISALNTLLLKSVLQGFASVPKALRAVKLSVVDSFGIIYPRTVFREDNEVSCLNHFMCTVIVGNAIKYSFAPGGLSFVRSAILAMTEDD